MASVVAVCRSAVHGFSKQPQANIQLIAGEGVQDDVHRGTLIQHLYLKRRDPSAPNLSQVHLFPSEMVAELATKGFPLQAGDLGENVLTTGLDLLALPRGTLLRLGPEAVVEVTGLRTPCAKIDGLRPGLQQHLWGPRDRTGKRTRRAGVMAVVLTSGTVAGDDSITVKLPPQPHVALGPV